MPKLVCCKCEIGLTPVRSGVPVLEHSAALGPYKLWGADKWGCRVCGIQVMAGFGKRPVAEHYEDGFSEKVESLDEFVNDYETIAQARGVHRN